MFSLIIGILCFIWNIVILSRAKHLVVVLLGMLGIGLSVWCIYTGVQQLNA